MRYASIVISLTTPAAAQRAPVLQQVKVPHPYYFREMLIPQVTSGPSAVTWSPDGRELIYSMQGSLWRQAPDSDEARQLTGGPGYDYHPDWSPDGRRVVYASYRDDAIELRMLDLATGLTTALVSNRAVNIEPRWSPDGSRIAYTSSAYEGRWHVFVVPVDTGGAVGQPERLTEDRDGGLPRYYYGRHDQYFSPAWSPDGKDLILVSNRGHVWGSGGLWRMAARPGPLGTELRREETTWKARPDWSPDGHRIVYASYLGRQWHQLWLMTDRGQGPVQLTYGEFDATAPRWSPSGDRIAYVSNETGTTSLWVLEVASGARRRVEARRRDYGGPVGRLRILVVDSAGKPLPTRLSVRDGNGRSFAPDDAWRHADDGFDRAERDFEYGYFHSGGSATLTVPAGEVRVEASRGPEWRTAARTVSVRPQAASAGVQSVRIVLRRLADLRTRGWYSGDLHVHMNYGGAYRADPSHLAFQARAEDLHLVENLIVNKEGRVPDVGYFTPEPDSASSAETLILHGQEFHTSFWGHIGLLGLRRHLILPGYSAYARTPLASLQPTNTRVFDLAREQGAIGGYVHPYDRYPDPADTSRPLTHALPVDVALGKVDYYETLGFVDDPMATAQVWYRLLNCGFRLPAGAGTDAMTNFASLRGPVGMNRVFVGSGKPLEHRRWLNALKAGRSFATNGPLLELTVNGRGLGDEVRFPEADGQMTARVGMRSIVPIDHLELVRDGEVVASIPLEGDRTEVTASVTLPVKQSGWVVLRARSDRAIEPVLDLFPYATTSPVYLTVGGRPARSKVDAEFFMVWLDRIRSAVEQHQDWNSAAERQEALETLARARAEFERRAVE